MKSKYPLMTILNSKTWHSLSPFNSTHSELLEDIDLPTLLDPTLPSITTPPPTKPIDYQNLSTSTQIPSSTTNKTSPPPNPPSVSQTATTTTLSRTSSTTLPQNQTITVTIDNDTLQSPTRKYTITEDPAYVESGVIPPILHPLQNPSQANAVSQDFQQQNPDYRFTIPKHRNTDHFIAFASRQHSQLSFWQSNHLRFIHLQFNFLRPTYFELNLDDANPDLLPYKIRKLHHTTYTKFLKHKAPRNLFSKITNAHLL